ncbi:MAG: hypothetical protein ACXW3D_01970 [Caulobacteraceae bacterium]
MAEPFSFVAYGDTAYRLPRDYPRYDKLVDLINAERPAFSIHVGDFKGYTDCGDEAYRTQLAHFDRHAQPLIYTPGDNDWFDCTGDEAGKFDPLDRLAALRRMFFGEEKPLGHGRLPVTRQDAAHPENLRWTYGGVVFATFHTIGPHNGLVSTDGRLALEAIDRINADKAWLHAAFAEARKTRAPVLVVATQIDAWITGAPAYEDGPLDWIRTILAEEAANYEGQVLVIHGDSHRLIIDHPFRRTDIDAGTSTGLNVTRLQVPGWPDTRAVRVDVDPSRPEVFSFRPIFAPDESHGAKP